MWGCDLTLMNLGMKNKEVNKKYDEEEIDNLLTILANEPKTFCDRILFEIFIFIRESTFLLLLDFFLLILFTNLPLRFCSLLLFILNNSVLGCYDKRAQT